MRPVSDRIRSISAEEIRIIKKATEAAYALAGGISLVHLRCRASVSQLSKYASTAEENAETLIPLDVALEVDRAAGSLVILSAYAQVIGFEIIPAASAEETAELCEMDAHRIGQHGAELAAEIFRAREDGVTDALEARAITERAMRLVRVTFGLVRRMR